MTKARSGTGASVAGNSMHLAVAPLAICWYISRTAAATTDQGHGGAAEQQQLPLAPPLSVAMAPQDEEMQQLPLAPPLDNEEEEAPRDLARMIALHGPSLVEDTHFRSFVLHLNPRFKLPTREEIEIACDTTISDDMDMAYIPWRQIAAGAGSFMVGKARFLEAGEAVYLTCNYIDDDLKIHRLVDHAYLVLPPGDHYNASASSLLGVPVVSAQVAAEHVVSYVFAQEYYPLMVAAEMTDGIGHLELKPLLDQKMTSIGIKVFCTTNMDLVFHSVARSILPNADQAENIFSSALDLQWARPERQRLLSELGLDDPLESGEQWYWCYCLLMMADHERLLTLDSQTLLCNLWGEIYNGIKKVSASNTPTCHLCLEELLKLRAAVQSKLSATSAANLPLAQALETVDTAIEDSYHLWSVAVVLDPRYKLRHIEEQLQKAFDAPKAAIYTARVRNVVKDLYIGYNYPLDDDSDEEMLAHDGTGPQDGIHAAAKTELDDYLEDSLARTTEGMDFDILSWWKNYGSIQYPTVAMVARDALAMPTCSKLTPTQSAHVKSIIRGYAKN